MGVSESWEQLHVDASIVILGNDLSSFFAVRHDKWAVRWLRRFANAFAIARRERSGA